MSHSQGSAAQQQPQFDAVPRHGERTAISALAHELDRAIQPLASEVRREDVEVLRTLFDTPAGAEIDYDLFGKAHATAFFLRNYHKAAYALKRDRARYHMHVADLGSGAAAASLAYVAYLADELGTGSWPVQLELVDRSQEQLDIAARLIEVAKRTLPNIRLKPVFRRSDIRDWLPDQNSPNCVFLSHVLTENHANVGGILEAAAAMADADARIYVLERADDRVWSSIGAEVSNLFVPSRIELTETEPQHYTTRYLKLSLPHDKALVRLVRSYFNAWRSQSVEKLEDVFSDDATYSEKPFDAPLRGISRIKQYWADRVLPQRNLSVVVRHISYTDTEACAEFQAEFSEHGSGRKTVIGTLLLSLDESSGKVGHLREYFRTARP